MDPLSTLPRRSWSERASLTLACGLIALGGTAVAGWFLQIYSLVQPIANFAPIKINGALSLFVLGVALLGLELGWKRFVWFALLPGVLNLLSLLQDLLHTSFHIDELLVRDHLLVDTATPGRLSAMAACCLVLASIAILLRGINAPARARLFGEAVVGSIIASAGFSTLLGYAAGLEAVYKWGSYTATAPLMAIGMLILGIALLTLAWRETLRVEGGPPAWSPMPAVIGCLTLTTILWIGLRERELAYLGAKTQTSMESLAVQISSELERQSAAIERLARTWGDLMPTQPVWEADAETQWIDAQELGCRSVSWVHLNLRTRWFRPKDGNEDLVGFDHSLNEHRSEAIRRARETGQPVVSGSVPIGGEHTGIVIYAPILHKNELIGYVAAEYAYQKFFHTLVARRLKLTEDYHVSINLGSDSIYTSFATDPRRRDDLTLDKSYTILDRRLRLSITPSEATLTRDRRLLPELALVAGFGITLFLGLSVHLARSARAGQRAAELSNRRLVAENEERRRIEARLKVSDERLRLALDSTQIGIFEWNVPANHVYYSPGLWSMLGYEHARMPATVEAWQSLIHPEDLPLYRRRIESQLTGTTAFIDPEYRMHARSGEWRWISTRAKTVTADVNGVPTRIIGTMQDITARRGAEQALRASQAEARKLSLVASKTDNPVLIGSPDGTIEWVNESFTRVMEYSLEEVVGRNPLEFMVGPETNPRTIVHIRSAMARGQGLATDVVNYSKSGRKYHLHLEIQPIFNESGQLTNFIAIESDITVRVETENQLRRAKAEADAASRSKSDFLASMSHEIRTPMNGVIGMTSLLMETPMTAEQRDFVNTIRTSGEALLTIINDILDFSKIESGKMEIEHMPFELALCIEEAFDLFALQASAKKIELVYNIEPGVPAWILGDVTRLRQIIVNLVNNAVKFTPSGSITIEIRRLAAADVTPEGGPLRLEFAVRDTGIGIPPDRLDRLFKAFSQVDSSTTRKYGGTGLGLVISQRLSALMGGDIRVESTVGQGSAFIFTIQTEAASLQTDSALPPLPARLQDGLILCVEDNPTTQAHLRTLLESWGALCAFTRTATVAREFASKLLQPPALVIIDGDETEGASALDELLGIKAPRLLMLPFGQNAPAAPEDGRPFATIYKPLKTAALYQAITQLFDPTTRQRRADAGLGHRRLLAEEFPLNVLLVEDNAVNQKVALRFLERLGYRADAVGNGLEAITTLEARHYDLVLMDVQMPEMDGFEASRQIRRRLPADQQPKIIALTANAMQGDREQCLAAGMDDYISKPVKIHEIIETIRRQFTTDDTVSADPFTPPATDDKPSAS